MAGTINFDDFGPGRLEALTVRVWRRRDRWTREPYQDIEVHVQGGYRHCCGWGWEHQLCIDERFACSTHDLGGDAAWHAWHDRDPESAAELASLGIEFATEDWTDPCADDDYD